MSEEECFCNEDHYVGEENTLFFIDAGVDVSLATRAVIYILRPDGTKLKKDAVLTTYNGSPDWVYFVVDKSDFNQEGTYRGQVWLEIGSWSGWGKPFTISVKEPISSSSSSQSSSSSSSSKAS